MADALLETAIANWAARLCANGVDVSDYLDVTSQIERWDDWCDAWCTRAHAHLSLGEAALREDRGRSAGEALARAATYYHFAQFLFVHDRPRQRDAHARAVDALRRALVHLDPPGAVLGVPLGDHHLVGVLRTPAGPGPHPVVMLIAGLDSAKEEFRLVEESFLSRGMGTFAFDGPGQGELAEDLPIRADWEDVGRAVFGALAARPDIDPQRIGVWGVSLGGYYAARVAGAGLDLRGTISLSGPYDFAAAWPRLNPLTRRAFEAHSHATSADDARRRAGSLTLEGRTASITGPLLVIAGQRDQLFDWRDGERLAREASGDAALCILADGNHGCANVVTQHRSLSADWMAQRMGLQPISSLQSLTYL